MISTYMTPRDNGLKEWADETLWVFCHYWTVWKGTYFLRIKYGSCVYRTRIVPVPQVYPVLGAYFPVKRAWISIPKYVPFTDHFRTGQYSIFDVFVTLLLCIWSTLPKSYYVWDILASSARLWPSVAFAYELFGSGIYHRPSKLVDCVTERDGEEDWWGCSKENPCSLASV